MPEFKQIQLIKIKNQQQQLLNEIMQISKMEFDFNQMNSIEKKIERYYSKTGFKISLFISICICR